MDQEDSPITDIVSARPGTVLLLGNYRVSLVIARQLGAAGHRIVAGGSPGDLIASCRHVETVWKHPTPFKNPKVFLSSLDELLAARPDISVILPVSEPYLQQLVKLEQQLPLPLAAVQRETVETCGDKGEMARIADSLGVPQAPFALADSLESLHAACRQVQYPCVARPNDDGSYEVKAYFIHNEEHLAQLFPVWPDEHSSLLVQAHARGPRFNRYFVASQGAIVDSLDVKVLRTDRPDGSGYAVEGMSVPPLPVIDEPSARLVSHLHYSGVGCIQYLFDQRSGSVSFLEINPRIGGNYAFVHGCGLDLVSPLLTLATRGEIVVTEVGAHQLQRRYLWLYGDLIGLMGSLHRREIGVRGAFRWSLQTVKALLHRPLHLTWDRQDLGPSKWFASRLSSALLVMLWDTARYLKRRLRALLPA